jgi:hypothetical protein
MSELDSLPLALRNRASWLINAGVEDTKSTLASMTGSADEIQILRAAIADEQAGQNRSSRLNPIFAALKRFGAAIPKAPTALDAIKASLEAHRGKLIEQEEAFFHASLPSRLKIGLQCLKAHGLFAIPDTKRKGVGGRKKNSVTHDAVSTPGGFEGWLAEEVPWLKKPTAYKYMTAVKGLPLKGETLTEASTEEDVDHALKVLRAVALDMKEPAPTLKSLCDAAAEAVKPQQLPAPPPAQQQEFDFLRGELSHFREQADSLLAIKDQLDGLPEFKKAAVARIYGMLHAFTGTHWTPSDEPDALASVDPDTITLS